MTDQDPTRPYEPPASPPQDTPAAPASEDATAPVPPTPPAPPAASASTGTPPPAPVAFAPAESDQPVASAPVERAPSGRKGGISRWLIVGALAIVVAAVAAGAGFLLTGSSGNSDVLAWTPADALVYGEARLDLPGDQAAEVATLMKAFPGFDDQAAFPVKLSEALDQLVGKASDGTVSWKTDIEPWFGGQVGGSVSALPAMTDPTAARAVLLVSVKDATKAKAWADGFVTKQGGTTSTEDYNGATITTVTPPAGVAAEMKGLTGGYVVVGPVLALGDVSSLKAVIDTKGTAGLPTNAQYKEASGAVSGDHLAFGYVDVKAVYTKLSSLVPGDAAALPSAALGQLPAWMVHTVRAENSALVLEATVPHSDLSGTGTASTLPGLVPSGTLLLADGHDFGSALKRLKDQLAQDDSLKDGLKQVDDGLSILGGFDAVTGWAGETGIAVTKTGDTFSGGIVSVPADAAAAERLFNQLKAFIQLGGAQAGLSVTEEQYNGTTISVVDLSGLSGLAGQMAQGVTLPADLKLSWAVTDKVVVLSYGTDFTKAVLDTAAGGPSLASDARFKDALTRVGATRTGLVWLDITGVRGAIEQLVPADEKATYDADVKPYLDAFDYLIETTEPGQTYDKGRAVLHVAGS
ncbi:MAG TPA: DUF3352 domain-containing protein [Candidatus Limnocylindrales bacterium]|nr:DUF3352 domain-containing protein [Candidatus Limnocylindrales bacterium]